MNIEKKKSTNSLSDNRYYWKNSANSANNSKLCSVVSAVVELVNHY